MRDVDLDVRAGEIHALVGENGAGKSTLAAIAYGSVIPDAGTVTAAGPVGLVHQHFQLIERLRVWENVLLGREPRRGPFVDRDGAVAIVDALAAEYGLAIDPQAHVDTLPVAIKQRVELLRELVRRPAVLVLDEPTAALAPGEIDAFFRTVRGLARSGTAVLIVTHKLAEVTGYSDRVTVMRAGTIVARFATAETDAAAIARAMVGGDVPALAARAATTLVPRLAVRGLSSGEGAGALDGLDLDVHGGEIVGIAGVEGNGQSALADALAGIRPARGEIVLDGSPLHAADGPAQRGERGLRIIPQDRRGEALVLDWSITENVILGRQRTTPLRRRGLIDRSVATRYARDVIAQFDVRPPDPNAIVDGLSGGNQQKLVVGRALAGAPALIVAYQPTRGVDVGAAALLQSRLIEARNAGAAVLLISFELDEIFALADRVLVLFNGRITGTFASGTFDRARIGALMVGGG